MHHKFSQQSVVFVPAGKEQALLISCEPGQHESEQDPKTEAAERNSAIIHFIIYITAVERMHVDDRNLIILSSSRKPDHLLSRLHHA